MSMSQTASNRQRANKTVQGQRHYSQSNPIDDGKREARKNESGSGVQTFYKKMEMAQKRTLIE